MLCSVCKTEEIHQDRATICINCVQRLGLRQLAPPRRPAVPCARCSGMKFVRVIPREITGIAGRTPFGAVSSNQVASPMGLTYRINFEERWSDGRDAEAPDVKAALGIVETYVCFKCGFVEWYCQDPTEIPIGQQYNSDIVEYASEQPYR